MYFKSKTSLINHNLLITSLLRGYENITIGRIVIIACLDAYTERCLETRTLYGSCKIFNTMRA